MRYFADRNIPICIARMLHEYSDSDDVVHEDEDPRFEPTTTDVFMIESLDAEDPRPVLLTRDLNMIARDAVERKALSKSGLTIVFFKRGTFRDLSFHLQAVLIVKAWDAILNATSGCREPTAFEVTAHGKVKRVCRTCDL